MKTLKSGWFVLAVIVCSYGAHGQTFMLDVCPLAPLAGPPGFGCAAEDPWGFGVLPGSPAAPSPIIAPLGLIDGDLLTTAMTVTATPGLSYIASLSDVARGGPAGGMFEYNLFFSVDRVTVGTAASGVSVQAALNQQPGDIFKGLTSYLSPQRAFAALAGSPTPFAGTLPTTVVSIPSNVLAIDDSVLGLPLDGTPGLLVGPAAVGPVLGPGTHNNIDGFDFTANVAAGGVFSGATYQSIYPDLAIALALPSADIYDIAPGGTTFCGIPAYATGAQMGLVDGDVIDAIVMFDTPPTGGLLCGGPGAQPGIDGVLFSLAPGSPSLTQPGVSLNPADVFVSGFSGNFAVYATAPSLGLLANPGGSTMAAGDNIDALEFRCLGDFDGNGVVNFIDLNLLVGAFGTASTLVDIDGNGIVNFVDVARFVPNFGCTGG